MTVTLREEEASLLQAFESGAASPDAIHRLCAVLLEQGKPVPLPLEETSLTLHLQTYPDRLDLSQRLCTVLAQQGKPVPLDLEERVLLGHLKAAPERADLKARLEVVQRMLGKAGPLAPVVAEDGTQAAHSEVDFQKEAYESHLRTGMADMDPAFLPIYEQARKFTMTSAERMYAVYQATRYLVQADVPGAFVECGVWRGGSMMVAMLTLLSLGIQDRDFFLYDTYEGLPRPDADIDVDVWGNRALDGWLPHARGEEMSNWAYASLEDVTKNTASTGYPSERIHFIKGMVEKTIPHADMPNAVALLRLDTDWYASTVHELEHLYPRLQKNGVLIIDDYGHFRGSRQAVDEYATKNKLPLLLNRIDYSGRLAIKIG